MKKTLKRIQRIETDQGVVWEKFPEPPLEKTFFVIQKIFARITGAKILCVTKSKGGIKALHDEADRLRLFYDRGIRVPKVIARSDQSITMEDMGIALPVHLRSIPNDQRERIRLVKLAAQGLANIHQKGLAHGRPHLKDIVWSSEEQAICFLDLEENVMDLMPMDKAQARDLWLFMGSVARYLTYDIDILTSIYEAYRKEAPDNIEPVLLGFVRMLRPFGWFVNTFFGSWVGSDVKNILVSQKVLEAYL